MCRLVEQTVLSGYCRFNYVLSLSASLVIELDYLNKILTSHSFSHSFFFFAASSSAISCSRCRFLKKGDQLLTVPYHGCHSQRFLKLRDFSLTNVKFP